MNAYHQLPVMSKIGRLLQRRRQGRKSGLGSRFDFRDKIRVDVSSLPPVSKSSLKSIGIKRIPSWWITDSFWPIIEGMKSEHYFGN